MMVLYTASLWFPGSRPATRYPVMVLHRGSNREALLFTDATGTTRADNPVTTDEFGQAAFWAPPGHYVTDLVGTLFDYVVDSSITDPVWPDLWVHTQSTPAVEWAIDHHFGIRPQVDVLAAGTWTVDHVDDEHTTITFSAPVSGIAHLRR